MGTPVCFGYEIRSNLSFSYVRTGGASDALEVAETDRPERGEAGDPIREWLPRAENPFHGRLFREGVSWRMWVAGLGSYHVDPSARRIEVPRASAIPREERLWGIPAVLCFLERGDHSLHAASVEIGGRAVAVGAPGRFGKTTLAAALVSAGKRLLSEDSTCVRLDERGVSVVPGPAMLRVRHDPRRSVEVPGTVVVEEDDQRVHLAVAADRRGDGLPVPLDAVVFLRPSDDGSPRLERITPEDAIADLWALSFHLPTDEDRARCFDRIVRLASAVPIWNLHRPMGLELLPESVRALEGLAS